MNKARKVKDTIYNVVTYLFSSFGLLVLAAIIFFIFSNGVKSFSWDLFSSDYYGHLYVTKGDATPTRTYVDPKIKGAVFSETWGISLLDDRDRENNKIVTIVYIDERSPFQNMIPYSNDEYGSEPFVRIGTGQSMSKLTVEDQDGFLHDGLARYGAQHMVEVLESGLVIREMSTESFGGGIRGSLIATLYLIGLTLLIAVPVGIASAIYLNEYAPKNKFTRIIRTMIDMTSGIPSIIFGLVGAVIFIPIMNTTIHSNGGSVASGALTLTIILLPIIIRTTEESLKVIPQSYRDASLALGASNTQTTFLVVLPNAMSGILASVLLSIGRIIGESAALIYAVGTVIKDDIAVNEKATSLAVHIWILMQGEVPNFELASTISILILILVFVLSMLVKIVSKKLNRYGVS